MALVCSILGKFLGVVCHRFPPFVCYELENKSFLVVLSDKRNTYVLRHGISPDTINNINIICLVYVQAVTTLCRLNTL
jgi:hypothetical protein